MTILLNGLATSLACLDGRRAAWAFSNGRPIHTTLPNIMFPDLHIQPQDRNGLLFDIGDNQWIHVTGTRDTSWSTAPEVSVGAWHTDTAGLYLLGADVDGILPENVTVYSTMQAPKYTDYNGIRLYENDQERYNIHYINIACPVGMTVDLHVRPWMYRIVHGGLG